MERHIKQQHPQHWCQKPRGSRRNHAATVPVIAPQFRTGSNDSENDKLEIDDGIDTASNNGGTNSNQEKSVKFDPNISTGNGTSSQTGNGNEDGENSEDDEEEGFEVCSDNGEDGSLIIDEPSTSSTGNGQEDLASVSKLLNTASAQSFQKVRDVCINLSKIG